MKMREALEIDYEEAHGFGARKPPKSDSKWRGVHGIMRSRFQFGYETARSVMTSIGASHWSAVCAATVTGIVIHSVRSRTTPEQGPRLLPDLTQLRSIPVLRALI